MIGRRVFLAGGAALATMPTLARAAWPVPADNRLAFDVVRKRTRLGTHILTFHPEGDALTVQVAVDIVFKLGPIVLYRYRHRATERWQGDQVVSLDTRTDDNGTACQVIARREASGLVVQGTKAPRYIAPANALPATHWNRRELDGPWINTQDGRIMRPRVSPEGRGIIPTADGGTVPARRFALSGDVQLDLWYDDRARWAGLSFVKGGEAIRYLRQG